MAAGTNGTFQWLARLALGANGQVLTMTAGAPVWANSASGFADPMTTRGDIIFRNSSNVSARLGIGANTFVLTSDGTDVSWAAGGGGGAVSSVFTRTGAVVAATNDYTWAQVNKATSNIADITTKSHTSLTDIGTNTHAQIDTALGVSVTHQANTSNPHSVTQAQVGLGSVDNTSDAGKPVSTAQQTALNLKLNVLNWAFLAINWDSSPVVNASITGGVVWTYIYNSVTRYRFVPTTYDASEDAFYTTFSSPTLSGLIVTRGV